MVRNSVIRILSGADGMVLYGYSTKSLEDDKNVAFYKTDNARDLFVG